MIARTIDDEIPAWAEVMVELEPKAKEFLAPYVQSEAHIRNIIQEAGGRVCEAHFAGRLPLNNAGQTMFAMCAAILIECAGHDGIPALNGPLPVVPNVGGDADIRQKAKVRSPSDIAKSLKNHLPQPTLLVLAQHKIHREPLERIVARMGISSEAVERHLIRSVRGLPEALACEQREVDSENT